MVALPRIESVLPRRRHDRASAPGAAPWFVALCMVVVAASLSAVLYLRLDLPLSEAGWIGFGALMVMVLAEFFAARGRERSAVEAELAALGRLAMSLEQDMDAVRRQLGEVEAALGRRVDEAVSAQVAPLTADLGLLEARVGELADMVAARPAAFAPAGAPAPAGESGGDDGPLAGLGATEALAAVSGAIDADRVDVLLQPVVSLPQRRVVHYEALTRLRGEHGEIILPNAYITVAEPAGVMPRIDSVAVERGIQIVVRLAERNQRPAMFCNISARALVDNAFYDRLRAFVEANPQLTGSLVLELSQGVFEALGPIEQSGLDSLAELGLRFSVDHVTHLDIDGAGYAARRVRYVKVSAGLLLNPPAESGARVHVADLARLLARSGIELIATHVETEAELVDVLDYDVRFGQGHLFSPPRPVRSDVVGRAGAPADSSS